MNAVTSNQQFQPLPESEEVFDPIACMRQIVEASGVSIEEIAARGNLSARHLKNALAGAKGAKLGLEEALTICQVLDTDAYARAWAKSRGLDVMPLPPAQNVSEDPVVHIRAAIGAIAPLLMMSNAIDRSDADKTKWLTSLITALSEFLNEATALSGKVSVSSNDIKRLDLLAMNLASKGATSSFPREMLTPFAQTVSNVYAAAEALKQFHVPAP
ncbi:hypothetical protein os4_36880 (plasmid) [Comamonadaceae bacterium OS-4]|nr:hypothetical protein os4_36880 [Comamonadaceae bacterium OS-4]